MSVIEASRKLTGFVVVHRSGNAGGLLGNAFHDRMINEILLGGLNRFWGRTVRGHCQTVIPEEWRHDSGHADVQFYNGMISEPASTGKKPDPWFMISNGRYVTNVLYSRLEAILSKIDADVVAVNVRGDLVSSNEKVTVSGGRVAGVRRLYRDIVMPATVTYDWPCFLFIRTDVLGKMSGRGIPGPDFSAFTAWCVSQGLVLTSLDTGGDVIDLSSQSGLLTFIANCLCEDRRVNVVDETAVPQSCEIDEGARLFGKVLIGKDVHIAKGAVIAGPVVLCDGVRVAQSAVIRQAVVGAGVSVGKGSIIQNGVYLKGTGCDNKKWFCKKDGQGGCSDLFESAVSRGDDFRKWPLLSYPVLFKRMIDISVSLAVLVAMLPIFPLVALIIKTYSPGPVFYKARRQGRYGREFNCLKFRSMRTDSDEIRDDLKSFNEVDGPQFKIQNDPRMTAPGKFLRDTFIDEIPQFINVLAGQMSLIGPRPSPEDENAMCAVWRDGRLSVRPGITGLWQISRTRKAGMDFQEWIHYDLQYVRDLSFKMDVKIFFGTAKKLITNFIQQVFVHKDHKGKDDGETKEI